jgi:hypothetical protein
VYSGKVFWKRPWKDTLCTTIGAELDTLKGDLLADFKIPGLDSGLQAKLTNCARRVVSSASDVLNNSTAQTVVEVLPVNVVSDIKDDVGSFLRKIEAIMGVLDLVAEIHPFVKGTPAVIFLTCWISI